MHSKFTCGSRAPALDKVTLSDTMLALQRYNAITQSPIGNTRYVLNVHLTSVTLAFDPLLLNSCVVRSLYHLWPSITKRS